MEEAVLGSIEVNTFSHCLVVVKPGLNLLSVESDGGSGLFSSPVDIFFKSIKLRVFGNTSIIIVANSVIRSDG